jgi:hypothetical protein
VASAAESTAAAAAAMASASCGGRTGGWCQVGAGGKYQEEKSCWMGRKKTFDGGDSGGW